MSTQRRDDSDFPLDSVIVVNPACWARRSLELGQLLGAVAGWRSRDRVIPDRSGRPPETTLTLADPLYWSRHVAELGDALSGTNAGTALPTGVALSGGAGAVPESPGRLTWTVDEAALALGVSRAFAYDAVRRGEIPAIKIGRRITGPEIRAQTAAGEARRRISEARCWRCNGNLRSRREGKHVTDTSLDAVACLAGGRCSASGYFTAKTGAIR
jgi:excisionase family DNA binding protein